MTDTIIMRGAYAITDPRLGAAGVIPAGAVVIIDGIVKQAGRFAEIASKYPGADIIGDGTQLLMPGLVDAHSRGRGLSPIQKERPFRLGIHADPTTRADRGSLCIAPPPERLHAAAPQRFRRRRC